jgi:diguanylate cyclase (GGDEF)-like protein
MIKNSKQTFIIFNLIVCFILFFIFFFTYKNQYLINNQNELLNNQVKRRTKRLKDAYKKLSEKNKELYFLASIDTLTKVKNRRTYFIESNLLLEKSISNEHNLHVAIIDIDDFKKINDKYGHAIGDEVLITFCEIVNNILDNNTIFARIGGEEFCLTFYDKEENEVNTICEIIRENCARNILIEDNQIITFTISIGLSSKISSNDSIDSILHKADESLYEAKNTGKNRLIRNRF